MAFSHIPTGKDMYIEINGKRIAVIEGYQAKAQRNTTLIEEFGNNRPICAIEGNINHMLTLKRVYFLSQVESQLDFYGLSDFSLVIVKPDKRILYTGCEWNQIIEDANAGTPCMESITISASERIEVTL